MNRSAPWSCACRAWCGMGLRSRRDGFFASLQSGRKGRCLRGPRQVIPCFQKNADRQRARNPRGGGGGRRLLLLISRTFE